MSDADDETRLPPLSAADGASKPSHPHPPPEVQGYGVTGPLGEGGMGVVWRAVQHSTRREVALKVLSWGASASPKARARFEREVELAARLEHPHIARVYDSGLYHGVYYYAMELIDGIPLDEYARRNGLRNRQMLELMRTVCRAVQHAHQRGVIHRDLKPSNILVTEDGEPHALDFGLAKALLEVESGPTVSLGGEVVGTPAYMSPEQAAGEVGQVDTRSDVYSLGVILYRLLIGESPHDLTGSRQALLQRIAREEPRRPRDVAKRTDKELEALLLKSLAHDPDDRYASAGDLADDIDRYLKGEPLLARAPTTIYFLRKRLRKHRVPAAVLSSALTALLALGVWSYVRIAQERADAIEAGDRARHEAAKATAVLEFSDEMLASIEPAAARGREVTVRDLLARASKHVGESFSKQPLLRAQTHCSLGARYVVLGDHGAACGHFLSALGIRRDLLGAEHPATLACVHDLASAMRLNGQAREAEGLCRQALEGRRSALGGEHRDTLRSMNELANILDSQNRYAEAEALRDEAIETSRRVLGEDHPDTLTFLAHHAGSLWDRGRQAEAEVLYMQVLRTRERVLGSEHRDTLAAMWELGNALWDKGNRDEALSLYRTVAEKRKKTLGGAHVLTLEALSRLGGALVEAGRYEEAEALHTEEMELRQQVTRKQLGDALDAMNELANDFHRQHRDREAEELHRDVCRMSQRVLGQEHLLTLTYKSNLANDLYYQGRFGEASTLHREVLEYRARLLGEAHVKTLASTVNLADALLHQGRLAEAEAACRRVVELGKPAEGERASVVRRAMKTLALVLGARAREGEGSEGRSQGGNGPPGNGGVPSDG